MWKNNCVKYIVVCFIVMVALILDQVSKLMIFNYLDSILLFEIQITSFFNIVKVWNRGVSFGLFSNLVNAQIILSIIAILISVFIGVWIYKSNNFWLTIALSLILGGALGNIIDRLRLGMVADFLDFHVGELHWPAFNLADSFVFIGVVIMIITEFSPQNKE